MGCHPWRSCEGVVCIALLVSYCVLSQVFVFFSRFFLEGGVGLSRQTMNVCVRVFSRGWRVGSGLTADQCVCVFGFILGGERRQPMCVILCTGTPVLFSGRFDGIRSVIRLHTLNTHACLLFVCRAPLLRVL